ncbi:MAG: type II toxin-antitoxin system prevent-host-death family antitoxin [Nitrospirae bacterium]|nr:type II toxin-antitoxin system prevent-host-death family antitoxin [Nitrospirota bacterium]
MKFVAVRELQINSSRILDKVKKGEDVVLTRLGKPEAALIHLTEDELDEFLVLRHPTLMKELESAYEEFRKKGGITQKAMKEKLRRRGKR